MEPPFRIRGGVTWYRFRILPRRQATPSDCVRSAHKPLSPWEFRRPWDRTDQGGRSGGLLFLRHGVDLAALDFLVHIPLGDEKTSHFRAARERYMVNPARSYACGDERKDFVAAVGSGMHPFMVSYGFEDLERLTVKIGVPAEIISRTPEELCGRVSNALGLDIVRACA